MKKKILIPFLLLAYCCFSQTELYWISKGLEIRDHTTDGNCQRVLERGNIRIHTDWQYATTPVDTDPTKEIHNISVNGSIKYERDNILGEQYPYTDICSEEKWLAHYEEMLLNTEITEPVICFTCLTVKFYAISLPQLAIPTDRKCEKEELFPQYVDGVNHNVASLTWEYLDRSNVWSELPSYENRYPLNVSLLDIFGVDWREEFDGNLQLRFKISRPYIDEVVYSRSIFTIQLTGCSPDLAINPPVATSTLCSYTNDGGFMMTVDRDLDDNEKLIVSLYKKDDTHPDGFSFYSQEDTTVLQDNGDNTYSYTWQANLPPDKYYIKFQTLVGNGNIPGTDPSWATLNESNTFMVNPAEYIEFEIVWLNDSSCFSAGNGRMELEVNGGERGRSFRYIIYKVKDGKETVYRNWTDFVGINTTIENLEKNKYRIKVQDNENCFARNP